MDILRNTLIFLVIITYSQSSPVQTGYKNHKNFGLLPKRNVCGFEELQDRVHGGNDTELGEYPWMALMEYKNFGYQCAGSLINDRYILTAAHCVSGRHKTTLGEVVKIRLGEYDFEVEEDCVEYPDEKICSDAPLDIVVEEVVPHSQYNEVGNINDIALIRLKTSVTYTRYIKPICLPINNEESAQGEILIVAGWGYTEKDERSTKKLKAELPIVQNENCTRAYKNKVTIQDSQLCAGGIAGIDSCVGDSGGPLMRTIPGKVNFYMEGIVSFGPKRCGLKNIPGVYTRVGSYIQWILDNIKQ